MNFILQPGSSHPPPPAYQQLKRGRPRDGFKFNPALAPKLPPINNIDILLQVFTHPSIRRNAPDRVPTGPGTGMDMDEYTDNERLSFLGQYALDAIVTDVLFQRRPVFRVQEIAEKKHAILLDESFDDWVTHYDLLRKLRCDPELRSTFSINMAKVCRLRSSLQGKCSVSRPSPAVPYTPMSTCCALVYGDYLCDIEPLHFPCGALHPSTHGDGQETRAIFHAYVGGLYVDSGPHILYEWISALLGQYLSAGGEPSQDEPMVVNEMSPPPVRTQTPPPLKKVKAEAMPSPPPLPTTPPSYQPFFATQPLPTPPTTERQAPIPPPPTPSMGMNRPNPLAPAQPSLPFLPLFNQVAAQRRVQVEYNAQFAGPSHAGTWVVRCIVNGISKGEGKGNSKQTAKEEAARQAFYAMGWT